MSPEKKALFDLGKIGEKKLSEVTVAEFLRASVAIDTWPLPDRELQALELKELLSPKFVAFWRKEKKKVEREVELPYVGYVDPEMQQALKNIEERLTRIEGKMK